MLCDFRDLILLDHTTKSGLKVAVVVISEGKYCRGPVEPPLTSRFKYESLTLGLMLLPVTGGIALLVLFIQPLFLYSGLQTCQDLVVPLHILQNERMHLRITEIPQGLESFWELGEHHKRLSESSF